MQLTNLNRRGGTRLAVAVALALMADAAAATSVPDESSAKMATNSPANMPGNTVVSGAPGSPDDTGLPAVYLRERAQVVLARKALESGNLEVYRAMIGGLEDYPLYPYLEYEALSHEFRTATIDKSHVKRLNTFEKTFDDRGLTRKLTHTLQATLVAQENWPLFLGVSRSEVAAPMPCARVRARFETGELTRFDEPSLALWTEPKAAPDLCAEVLDTLEARGAPPIKAIWERIYASMDANQPERVEPLLRYLGSADRKRVKAWLAAAENPQRLLKSGDIDADTQYNRRVFVDLVLAWSSSEPEAAMAHWLANYKRYTFYADRYYDTHRLLAMRGAYRRLPEAYDWLNSLEARPDDLDLREWRVRAALLAEDWPQVLRSLYQLPKEEQEQDHWRYWEAHALSTAGHTQKAEAIWQELAELQSYHGFLSAGKLGLPYAIENQDIEAPAELFERLSQHPGLVRAREFHAVGIAWEGRREWNSVMDELTPEELAAMAVLAQQWGLHDRAIFAAGRAEQRQALKVRFPLLYRSAVARQAADHRLDPAWVFGVMRRESAYVPDIRSGAGAIGLMQLMPRTAKYVAKLKGQPQFDGNLTEPDTNIELGTGYLRHVLDTFDDHVVLATASYNAGPSRVKRWLPEADMPADLWIDTIPYSETRRYVQAVLAYTAIYQYHLTGEPEPMPVTVVHAPKDQQRS